MDRRGGGGGGAYNRDHRRPYYGGARNEPPPKRARNDWAEDTYDPQPRARDAEPTDAQGKSRGPILMTFKAFLATQDDSVADDEAIKRYQEYKAEFRRKELHDFFVEHKDEQWFRLKYHPEESKTVKEEQLANVRSRCQIFEQLMKRGYLNNVQLDDGHTNALVKFMDALVFKLEGGTEADLDRILDAEYGSSKAKQESKEKSKEKAPSESDAGAEPGNASATSGDKPQPEDSKSESNDKNDEPGDKSELGDAAAAENGQQPSEHNGDVDAKELGAISDDDKDGEHSDTDSVSHKRRGDGKTALLRLASDKAQRHAAAGELHKTNSVFLRNVAPNITVAELESVCKRFPGFLRVGLSEPQPDRKFYRRGWLTFRRDVNIKEICWNLSSIRVRDCDLGAIVNRDLTRRVRCANGLHCHRAVAQNDLRLAVRLCQACDERAGLWGTDSQANPGGIELPPGAHIEFGIQSNNPLLQHIEDFLIEEEAAEEDELLGRHDEPVEERRVALERDAALLDTLDKVLVYLRAVHSVDYYNYAHYGQEDSMPHRCGLMHVRATPPSAKELGSDDTTGAPLLSQQAVNDWIGSVESKLSPLFDMDAKVSDEQCVVLGKKDPEREVEAFITANSVEMAKDKWLCPLSGKKFKGPEFVRKHITGKHNEKLAEVSVEVAYFNNYLADPKRPAPPPPEEVAQAVRAQQSNTSMSGRQGGGPPQGGRHDAPPYNRGGGGDNPYNSGNRGPPDYGRDRMPYGGGRHQSNAGPPGSWGNRDNRGNYNRSPGRGPGGRNPWGGDGFVGGDEWKLG